MFRKEERGKGLVRLGWELKLSGGGGLKELGPRIFVRVSRNWQSDENGEVN